MRCSPFRVACELDNTNEADSKQDEYQVAPQRWDPGTVPRMHSLADPLRRDAASTATDGHRGDCAPGSRTGTDKKVQKENK